MERSRFQSKRWSRAVREEFAYVKVENEVEDNYKIGFAFPEGNNRACKPANSNVKIEGKAVKPKTETGKDGN